MAVAVYRYSTASWLEDQDFWRLYGNFRDVYLYAIPKVHVQDLFVKGDYDYQTKAGQLDIDLKTVGDYEDKKINMFFQIMKASLQKVMHLLMVTVNYL